MSVHSVAQTGFGAGTNELYDRARPSYQPFALSYIRDAWKGEPPMNIVEIGAGTGIFTRALLAHPQWASEFKEIKAIEPSAGMRKVFSQTIKDQRVSINEGTFDETGVESQWGDIIFVAQAFHWCPDYDRACSEFSRILKPSGVIVFIWNLEDRDKAGWVAQLRDCIEEHEHGTPQFRLGLWRRAFDTNSYKESFMPPIEKTWPYTLPTTIEATVERASSKSYISILPEDKKLQVQSNLKEIVQNGDGKVWIDQIKGVFEYPYKCFVVVSQKAPVDK